MRTEQSGAESHGDRSSQPTGSILDSGGSWQRADLAGFAFLGVLWIAMAALANPIGDFPLNDDWVYALAVKSILELGEFRLPSPASANIFSQAYWGALFCLPFGFSFTALRVSTLTLGLVGVYATFGILRELGVARAIALVAAALVAGNPLYFALANTFMTDVPFIAVAAASVFFLVRWTLRLNGRDALIGLLVAMIAILVRQAGIVIPLCFAIAYVVKRGLSPRTIAVAIIPIVVGVLLHYGFQAWLQQTGRTPLLGEPPLFDTVAENLRIVFRIPLRLYAMIAYAGLFALPILAIVAWPAWDRSDAAQRRTMVIVFAIAAAVSVAAVLAIGRPMPFLDNVLTEFGMGPLTLTDNFFLGRSPPAIPAWLKALWYALTFAAILGTGLLACLVAYGIGVMRSHPQASRGALPMIIIGGSGIVYTLLGMLALRFFYDRYVLFLLLSTVLFAGSLAAGTSSGNLSRKDSALLVLVLVLQAAFSVVATRDYLEWNRTRWVATNALLAAGIPLRSIDGGYEFNGWLGYDPGYQRKQGKSPWWVVDDEYRTASGPLKGYSVVRTYPFRRLLTGQESPIFVLHRDGQ